MTATLIVGWKTKLALSDDALASMMPVFRPPSNYKDPVKIAEVLEAKMADWYRECKFLPYVSTFDSVVIADPTHERVGTWSCAGREPGGKKAPICLAVKNWLLKKYPDAWPDELVPGNYQPKVVFVGFEPRGFLKLLGIECSLPQHDQPLPLTLWYGEVASRSIKDITEACIPHEFRGLLDWPAVFLARKITPKKDWQGPGQDPEEDVRLVTELSSQLGFRKE